jgi:hypothetical protein
MNMNDELIDYLKGLANQECFYDDESEDVMVDDYAGGNIDDAFSVGETAGETILARKILKDLGLRW